MNVYDFDNTIFRGDSTAGFVFYLYRRRPKTLINLPRTLVCGLLYGIGVMPKLTFKTNLYRMFRYVDDMEEVTDRYVDSRLHRIKDWYKKNQREDDVVVSASPEFLIDRFCERIGIRTSIASDVDMHTGEYTGLNCHGSEKVVRLRRHIPDAHIEQFYSDSYSDTPLAELAEKAYLVKGDRLLEWKNK